MFQEIRDVTIVLAVYFIAPDKPVLVERVQDSCKIHIIVREHIGLDRAGAPLKPALPVADRPQSGKSYPQRKLRSSLAVV